METTTRIGYTRGAKLHALRVEKGRVRTGRTLCGRIGYVHPNFISEGAVIGLALKFNGGCERCIRALEEE